MTPTDLLVRLKAEGVDISLNLKVTANSKPSDETLELLRCHRDDLIIFLTMDGSHTPQMCRSSEQLKEGAAWCRRCYRYQLRPCMASEKFYRSAD